jgi:hypothetical protein
LLTFNPTWRFNPPIDDELHHGTIPPAAVEEFTRLIRMVAVDPVKKAVWEQVKRRFCSVTGESYGPSSSTNFAEYDGQNQMMEASRNAPLFIEAIYDVWTSMAQQATVQLPPGVQVLNTVLAQHGIGYSIAPPDLLVLGVVPQLIDVTLPHTTTLGSTARDVIRNSLETASEHLSRGDGRAAVMESLWLLDSVTTVFSGLQLGEGQVSGIYFNTIINDLRRLQPDTSLPHIMRWMESMYGYLSSPGGGQIRHGMNLSEQVRLNANEARLYCNLTRSFIEFLLSEHERLTRS